ncbi:MAG TPA: sigma-70 family RNA polymerase sigma factor [Acidimicrobiales bacterium]|nr:sigma-70 family RNA polymerase sigma factor [Acidimicrobiales bacterium]
MQETDFEAERPRLRAIAVRILGSRDDADDVLQEAWFRLSRSHNIEDLPAWLTTVVTRLCLDHLRKQGKRLEVESKLAVAPSSSGPEADALFAEAIGDAMTIVLDTLAPAERVAFVLHDVFGNSFDEISGVMGRSGTAVRQLASRARRRVRGLPEAVEAPLERAESRRVVDAFLSAARGGDLGTLVTLLAPDAIMRADVVAQGMGTQPVYDGADAVAARFNGNRGALPATIDGELGAAWFLAGSLKVAFVMHVDAGRIHEVELIADPDVLMTLDVQRVRRQNTDDRAQTDSNP